MARPSLFLSVMIPFIRIIPLTVLLTVPFASVSAHKAGLSSLQRYMEGQVASFSGNPDLAARDFFSVFNEHPDDKRLALKAYREAQVADNTKITLATLSHMEKDGFRTGDGPFLILAKAVQQHRWKEAHQLIDRMEQNHYALFPFAPLLRAWVKFGAGEDNPLSELDKADESIKVFVPEVRGLLLLATGEYDEALPLLEPSMGGGTGRANRLRILAAGIMSHRDGAKSRALLEGSSASLAKARQMFAKNPKSLPSKLTVEVGMSELFLRMAALMGSKQSLTKPVGLGLGRASSWMTPNNAENWLIIAEILSSFGQLSDARIALNHITPEDPFYNMATSMQISFYLREKRKDMALNLAQNVVRQPDATVEDWYNLAEIEGDSGNFDAALAALSHVDKTMSKDWQMWILKGNLLDAAGHWPEAKAAYEQAVAIAPNNPITLNTLGYSQLEKRENIQSASILLMKALGAMPIDPAIIDSCGWSQYLSGRVDDAVFLLENAAELAPKESTIYEHLGDAYWTAGRHFDARYAWQASLVTAEDKATARIKGKIDLGLTPALAAP
ncbi:tetratricopeptide repeat protein [Zymomonas mobilis]|uniref:Tetratricopeptide repeat protein n=1 Tax=Zymomonas mobilis TaxID=542 RepID=A0A542W1T8_ZYMMB|nr:tetratricopeptide repeat protein [Zymomonas mobilis]TQL17557.1 tetratricopeptide repeat protein [Zymomonas mobilis]